MSTGLGEWLLVHMPSGFLWKELWDHCYDMCRWSVLQRRHLCGDHDWRLHLPLPSELHWLQLWEEAGPLQQQTLSERWVALSGGILWLKPAFYFAKIKGQKKKNIWKAIVREFKWNYSTGEQMTDVLEADWNISAVYRWPVFGPWSERAVPLSAWLHWCQLPSQHWWLCFSPLPECRDLSRWFEWLHLLLHAGLHWQELQRAIRCLWRTSVPKWWHMLHPLYRTGVPVPKGLHGAKLWVHIAEQLQASATPNFPPFLDHHHHLLHTDCPAAGSGGGCYLHEEKEDTAGQETAERHCCLQWSGDS